MTDESRSLDYNDLAPLLTEFDGMRKTLMNFVQLIKKQDERIKVLEAKLASVGDIIDPRKIMQERFAESCKHNRNLNEAPERIAYAAYLSHVKQVPAMRVAECGVLSQSKMHGLTKWTTQHLMDFLELNNVANIYANGLDDVALTEMIGVDNLDKLKGYMSRAKEKNS